MKLLDRLQERRIAQIIRERQRLRAPGRIAKFAAPTPPFQTGGDQMVVWSDT